VMACADAGKHLLCEKPVGVNAAEAYEMWAAYRDAGLAHYVPFWTRYCEPLVRTREVLESGLLGDIRGVVYRWHNPRPDDMPLTWRDDAGLSAAGSIADVGSHAYDTLRWLLGREATRVQAHADTITPARADLGAINLTEALALGQAGGQAGAPRRKGTTFDYASVAWEFDDGAVATLVLSHTPFFRKGIAPELELHGTKASLGLDRVSGNLTLAKPGEPVEIITGGDHRQRAGQRFWQSFREICFPKPAPGIRRGGNRPSRPSGRLARATFHRRGRPLSPLWLLGNCGVVTCRRRRGR